MPNSKNFGTPEIPNSNEISEVLNLSNIVICVVSSFRLSCDMSNICCISRLNAKCENIIDSFTSNSRISE
jgi:hypothetical protein